ncbi:MAG: ATP-binding protein, partial [Cyanobacteria bacterium J06560_2]
ELRTPLNSIIGFAQLLNRDTSLQPNHKERTHIISRSGEHLLSLINNILDISKIEARKITMEVADFDLDGLLEDVLNMFDLKVKQKGIQLTLVKAENVPRFLNADAGKLRQVLVNLLANGIKFTDRGAVVLSVRVVTPSVFEPVLSFSIKDTGAGIEASEFERLFAPFEQATAGRAIRQGTGLGLAISQQYCQLMGGQISVESQVGEGSTFEIQLPMKLSTEADWQRHQQTGAHIVGLAEAQADYRIVVADDVANSRALLSELLTSVGFSVKVAENGAEAVSLYQSWNPHFIWMDLLMPGVDGYEATRQIRSHQGQEASGSTEDSEDRLRPVIVALSASAIDNIRETVEVAGFDDYLPKPFQPADIWAKLAEHLQVEFVYEDTASDLLSVQAVDTAGELTADLLSLMPAAWRRELHTAASQIKGKKVMALIEEIPAQHAALEQSLRAIADSYQFDQIVKVIDSMESLS